MKFIKPYIGTVVVVLVVLVILTKVTAVPASIRALFGFGPNATNT